MRHKLHHCLHSVVLSLTMVNGEDNVIKSAYLSNGKHISMLISENGFLLVYCKILCTLLSFLSSTRDACSESFSYVIVIDVKITVFLYHYYFSTGSIVSSLVFSCSC